MPNEYQKMLNDALLLLAQVWVRGESVDYLAAARSTLNQLYGNLENAVPKLDTTDEKPVSNPDTGNKVREYGG